VVGAGEFVHVPADTPHGFTNTGDTEGRLLIIAQPAGVLEPAVMELGTPLQGEEPSPAAEESSHLEHAQAVFERYGWRLILPPEAAQPRA
ncbi:MAG TPA: cupin domain-containing protein, partial [Thermomicrobiaceae bacterium]|nr:cupin domain-containing protein [Thermomicrobiaceae bacterium]